MTRRRNREGRGHTSEAKLPELCGTSIPPALARARPVAAQPASLSRGSRRLLHIIGPGQGHWGPESYRTAVNVWPRLHSCREVLEMNALVGSVGTLTEFVSPSACKSWCRAGCLQIILPCVSGAPQRALLCSSASPWHGGGDPGRTAPPARRRSESLLLVQPLLSGGGGSPSAQQACGLWKKGKPQ